MKSETDINCLVIHGVDLLPWIDSHIYTCPNNPRHTSSEIVNLAIGKINLLHVDVLPPK